ncbi:MAG: hypothetical protein IJX19_07375, partial [Clostridia bacterium]|nr:hypothetical protein [Clostridia bacterium]
REDGVKHLSVKVLVKLFQKLAGWRGRALLAPRKGRNSTLRRFFFANFFLCAYGVKEKSG